MSPAGLRILLLLAPLEIILGAWNRGNCSFLNNMRFKLVCHSSVTSDLFSLYRDNRAPKNTPYSVWESEGSNDSEDPAVLVSFHDNYLHNYQSIRVENYGSEDSSHSFDVRSADYFKRISYGPSLLYCFAISLRYPMELRSHCLGLDRSLDVAKRPVLFYAMEDFKPHKSPGSGASTVLPLGALLAILSALLVVVL